MFSNVIFLMMSFLCNPFEYVYIGVSCMIHNNLRFDKRKFGKSNWNFNVYIIILIMCVCVLISIISSKSKVINLIIIDYRTCLGAFINQINYKIKFIHFPHKFFWNKRLFFIKKIIIHLTFLHYGVMETITNFKVRDEIYQNYYN